MQSKTNNTDIYTFTKNSLDIKSAHVETNDDKTRRLRMQNTVTPHL